ncbi:uncharacterized protein RAG0_12870 [Rhynchosporium agropyri]|uniref:Uncharacterized protein n=1 Tax=Rhynchosporium agropyri TaxID=914238 RepID=A0A1E1L9Z3_9HELO|nr:uncharacterized protein RAG0_12870 [Rhynchosporium agropyri]
MYVREAGEHPGSSPPILPEFLVVFDRIILMLLDRRPENSALCMYTPSHGSSKYSCIHPYQASSDSTVLSSSSSESPTRTNMRAVELRGTGDGSAVLRDAECITGRTRLIHHGDQSTIQPAAVDGLWKCK